MQTPASNEISTPLTVAFLGVTIGGTALVVWLLAGMPAIDLPDLPPLAPTLGAAFWLALAGLAGWVAAQRGRSVAAWVALSLLLGPFALLAVGMAPAKIR